MSNEVFAGINADVYMKIVYSVILLSMVLGVILMPLSSATAPAPGTNITFEIPQADNPEAAEAAARKMTMQVYGQGGGGMGVISGLQGIVGFAAFICWIFSILAFTVFKEKFTEFGETHMKFVAGYIAAVFLVGMLLSVMMGLPILGVILAFLYSIAVAFLFYVAFDMFKNNKNWNMDSYKAEVLRHIDVVKSKINKPKEG